MNFSKKSIDNIVSGSFVEFKAKTKEDYNEKLLRQYTIYILNKFQMLENNYNRKKNGK